MPNNNKAIEIQLMKKFLRDVQTSATQLPEEFTEKCSELLSATITMVRAEQLVQPISITAPDGNTDFWSKHNIRVPNFSRKKMLSDEEGTCLLKLYCELYKVSESQVAEMSLIYLQHTHTRALCGSGFPPTFLATGTGLWRSLSQHSLDRVWISIIFLSVGSYGDDNGKGLF